MIDSIVPTIFFTPAQRKSVYNKLAPIYRRSVNTSLLNGGRETFLVQSAIKLASAKIRES